MKKRRPLERLNAYSMPSAGGMVVDTEGMFADLVTVMKAGGVPKEGFLQMAAEMWDAIEVEVTIPLSAQN